MVIGLKDNICYAGHHVSASSKILEGFESLYSSTVVEKLLAQDAIIIGRCNNDEFAMGSSSETCAWGPVKNPVDPTRVPGGSSSGAAVSVATGAAFVGLGSDTGGSIRIPAALNVGHVPTVGSERPLTVEAHLIGWSGDCYDRVLGLDLIARLRGEQRFATLDALVAQIRADIATVALLLAKM